MAYTFVLVHGAWHGGWCWQRVADRLRGGGHTVFTPTLTGLGERSHLLRAGIELNTHITDIVNVMTWEDLRDVVLCGHSYGGFVVSGVAEQMAAAIRSIVFLDAFVPRNGESVLDLTGPAVQEAIRNALQRGDIAIPPRGRKPSASTKPTAPGWIVCASCSRSRPSPTRSRSPARAIVLRARAISAPSATPIRDLTGR
jgi:pimeloyl-ACP methyl ester carboxylesterase